jgi:hypothetical protein
MTSTRSRITRPSTTSPSSWGKNARILSPASTLMNARAGLAQPAPPAHLGPALGPAGRQGHGRPAVQTRRPGRHRRRAQAVHDLHPAVVLHPRRSQGRRRRGDPRPGRRPDRHRNPHRAAARRPGQLPEQPARLDPIPRRRPPAWASLNPNITGNRTYTRAHFLSYAQVVTPGTYR